MIHVNDDFGTSDSLWYPPYVSNVIHVKWYMQMMTLELVTLYDILATVQLRYVRTKIYA